MTIARCLGKHRAVFFLAVNRCLFRVWATLKNDELNKSGELNPTSETAYLENSMLEGDRKRKHFSAVVRLWVVAIALLVLTVGSATSQDPNLAVPPNAVGTSAIPLGKLFGDGLYFSTAASAGSGRWPMSDAPAGELAGSAASTEERLIRSGGMRRITLEQVKQQRFVNPSTSPLARLGQLSIEAAKQHRLGVQTDYFPKLGATFANLHFSEFLGQVLTIRRPISRSLVQIPVPHGCRIPSPATRWVMSSLVSMP